MKSHLLTALLLALTSVAGLQGAPDPAPEKLDPANIAVDLRCVSLPQAQALPIVRKLRSEDPRQRAQAITELDDMLAKETATLLAWLNVITHLDVKAVTEETEEVRYASEYVGPSKTYNFAEKEDPLTKEPRTVEAMAAQAASLDTRNTGFTLEVEPSIFTNRRTLNLKLVASHICLKSMDRLIFQYENAAEKRIEKTTVEQPRFTEFKVQSEFTIDNGDHQLIGLFRAPTGKNQFELFILGVEIREHK